jgi:alanyl-tRNA synthetase
MILSLYYHFSYVLRRILRRGIRFAVKKLNAKPGFFASLVDTVVEILGDAFPELKRDPKFVKDVINEEEEQFLKTLTRGQKLLEKTIAKLENTKNFPGDVAWRLYDTYGFPIDLTQLICEENGLFVDMVQYNESKQQSQLQSQQVTAEVDDSLLLDVHAIDELKSKFFLFTHDSPKYDYKYDESGNYSLAPCQAKVKAIRFNKQFVDEIKVDQMCGILLEQTSFYAEQGGQIFDEGYITKISSENDDEQSEFIVKNVQVRGGFILHIGKLTSSNLNGTLKVLDSVNLHVDMVRRRQIMSNHTATHVLNFGLRKVLSEADQRGSLVAPDKFRFDFTAKKAMTVAEVGQVENICNEVVDRKLEVHAKETPLSIAKAIQGLRAVFDETYPDPVRVVSVGKDVFDLIADPNGPGAFEYSVEFCGGTHLLNSSHIKRLIVVSEEAIAKGVRRIIAVTGGEAIKAIEKADQIEKDISKLDEDLKSALNSKENLLIAQKNLNKKLNLLNDDISQSSISHVARDSFRNKLTGLKKQLDDIDKANKTNLLNEALEESKTIIEGIKNSGNTNQIVKEFKVNGDAKLLNTILTLFKQQLPTICCMFFSIDYINNKIVCLSSVPDVSLFKLKFID